MQHKIMQGVLAVLFISIFIKISTAQNNNGTPLNLEDALERTVANNQQIKIAGFEHAAALEDVEKMKSIYLPQIEAIATGSATNTPLNAFGTKLQQGAISQADFNPADLNEPSSISNLNTQLMVKQPIINMDAAAMRKAVFSKSEAYQYQAARTEKVLRHHVVQAYLQLQLTYKMLDVLNQAKATTEANLKLANDNMEAGYIQRADVLAVQVRLNEIETQIFQTENNIQSISDQLSFLMGSGYGEKFFPDDKLEYIDESAILMSELQMTRSDIMAMERQVDAHQFMLEAAEKKNYPRVNAFGSYELNNSFDFDDSQHGYLVGLQASWLLFNGNKNKSDVRKAKIELEKSRMQLAQFISQNQMEFEMAKRKMTDAQMKIGLAEKSIEQSKESLRIKTDRFAEGLERTTDVLIAETTVAQKEMEYAEAVFQYKLAYAELLLMLEQN